MVTRPSPVRSSVVNFFLLSTSPLKPLNGIQRNLTGSKIATSSTKFVFFGPIGKQDGRPGLWLAEKFSTSPLKPLNAIQGNLTGSKICTDQVFVFMSIRKKQYGQTYLWLPVIGWDIFNFFSVTAGRNSTKLDRKQDLSVLYHVWIFRAHRKTRWPPWPLIGWDIFDWYLLWNCWKEFNETWQESISQRPLPSLRFSGWSEKQNGRPDLWLTETFQTSPLQPLNGIQRNLKGSITSSSKFVCVFFFFFFFFFLVLIFFGGGGCFWFWFCLFVCLFGFFFWGGGLEKQDDGCPVRSVKKGSILYSGARYVARWAPCKLFLCSENDSECGKN